MDTIDSQSISSYNESDFKRDFEKFIKPYNKTINDMTIILHDCCQRVKLLEKNISETTFILEIQEDEFNDIDLKKVLSRFSGVEKELYGCLYDRNGYNEYYVKLQTLDDLALLQQKLGARLFIDFNRTIPRIALEENI